MDQLKKLGVYITGEPGDDEALAFAALLARAQRPESIHCIHVRGIEGPTDGPVISPEDIEARLRKALPPELAAGTRVHISGATGLPEILRTARDRDLDLLVVGRRLPTDQLGLGSVFYRLARKTPCDVLVVPQHAYAHLNRLLVLVDGSDHSLMALRTALRLARSTGGPPQVLVQSVFDLPYGYRKAGVTIQEAIRQREALRRKELEACFAGIDTTGVDFQVVYTCARDTAAAAHSLASADHMDAIVVGSRGATLPAIALLGGTAERVLLNAPTPVLVVKRKGETFGFLDAVLAQFKSSG